MLVNIEGREALLNLVGDLADTMTDATAFDRHNIVQQGLEIEIIVANRPATPLAEGLGKWCSDPCLVPFTNTAKNGKQNAKAAQTKVKEPLSPRYPRTITTRECSSDGRSCGRP